MSQGLGEVHFTAKQNLGDETFPQQAELPTRRILSAGCPLGMTDEGSKPGQLNLTDTTVFVRAVRQEIREWGRA